jgi:hypothetical protein
MQSALSALALASVSRIVEALPAVIAAQSFEKLRYSQTACAMQPRPCTAVMAPPTVIQTFPISIACSPTAFGTPTHSAGNENSKRLPRWRKRHVSHVPASPRSRVVTQKLCGAGPTSRRRTRRGGGELGVHSSNQSNHPGIALAPRRSHSSRRLHLVFLLQV